MLHDFSPKQIEFYNNTNHRINIAEGSVRSGKSFITLLRFIEELKSGPDGSYLICGKSERTVLHNIIEPLQNLVGGIVRYNRGLGEFSLFNRKVYVVGANDERAEGKIRGATFAGALVDEASIIPESFFKMLLSRLSVPNAKLFATTNPDSPYHWLKRDFIDRQDELDLTSLQFRLTDNPSLTKEYINALCKEYRGLWYKRFIEGQWVLAEGSVFDFFDTKIHVKRTPPSYAKYYLLGIDYGVANPFAAVLIGFNDDYHPALWAEKEYYWDSKEKGYQKTVSELAADVHREFGGYPIKLMYRDPSALVLDVEFKRLKMPIVQAKNDVLEGILHMSNLLVNGDLVICNSCKNLLHEIEGYVWDSRAAKQGEDKPLKQRDHAIDAMRYALFTHYGSLTSLKSISPEENYQLAQQRKWQRNPMDYPGFTNSTGWQRA